LLFHQARTSKPFTCFSDSSSKYTSSSDFGDWATLTCDLYCSNSASSFLFS
jgi:hypothetical protein